MREHGYALSTIGLTSMLAMPWGLKFLWAPAVELLTHSERGIGNGVQVAAYRIGMIVGGGALLVVLEWIQWRGAMLAMATLLAIAGVFARPGMMGWLLVLMTYKAGDAMFSGYSAQALGYTNHFLLSGFVCLLDALLVWRYFSTNMFQPSEFVAETKP